MSKGRHYSKDEDYRRLLTSYRWLRLRQLKLSRNPLCERCEAEGYVTAATEVHHVIPVEEGVTSLDKERLCYDMGNLRSLCHACHVRTHTESGRCGKAAALDRRERQRRTIFSRLFGEREEG